MAVYCSSPLLWTYTVADVVRIAADLGYTGVEVWVQQAWWRGDTTQAIRAAAAQYGIALTAHAVSWDLNITALHEPIRKQSLVEVSRSIEFAAECGTDVVTIHPGRLTVSTSDLSRHWDLQLAAVRQLAQVAATHGVRVSVELMEQVPREFIISPEDVNRLIETVNEDNVGVTFDVAHIPLSEKPSAWLAAVRRPFVIHLSDTSPSRLHLPLGEGTIDMEHVIPHVVDLGLPIVLEGFEPTPTRALAAANKSAFDRLLTKGRARQQQVAGGC